MTDNTEKEFNWFQSIFWPIHKYELKKFFPMVIMMGFFLFNYTIMRDTKDTLVVVSAGAEVLPFLKFWGTLPTSIFFVLLYSKLSNSLKPETLFYSMVSPFLVFFLLFGFVIYPNMDLFSPTQFADAMHSFVLNNFPGSSQATFLMLVKVIRVWPYAIFYIFSELWGSMGVSLLFWQFANQITKTNEAKRFYSSFIQLGNVALIASGFTIILCSNIRSKVPEGIDAWGVSLKLMTGAIGAGCFIIMVTYYWINRNVLTDPKLYTPEQTGGKKKSKPKLSIAESFIYLAKSKYMRSIAMLVLSYGITINLIEIVWKSQLKIQFPNENDYSTFMGYFSMTTGVVTLALITVGGNVIRRFGWLAGAITTPVMVLVTGGLFFAFIMFKDSIGQIGHWTPLWLAVIIGATQNVLSKSTKYSLFDPTKEMAYIPLGAEEKVKGKAAIDVVGARLGKSGGGVIMQLVLMFGTIMDNIPVLLVIVSVIVFSWIKSVLSLNILYKDKVGISSDSESMDSTGATGQPA